MPEDSIIAAKQSAKDALASAKETAGRIKFYKKGLNFITIVDSVEAALQVLKHCGGGLRHGGRL